VCSRRSPVGQGWSGGGRQERQQRKRRLDSCVSYVPPQDTHEDCQEELNADLLKSRNHDVEHHLSSTLALFPDWGGGAGEGPGWASSPKDSRLAAPSDLLRRGDAMLRAALPPTELAACRSALVGAILVPGRRTSPEWPTSSGDVFSDSLPPLRALLLAIPEKYLHWRGCSLIWFCNLAQK
jgi:hypothetical protein